MKIYQRSSMSSIPPYSIKRLLQSFFQLLSVIIRHVCVNADVSTRSWIPLLSCDVEPAIDCKTSLNKRLMVTFVTF